jgi:hypothetical protein
MHYLDFMLGLSMEYPLGNRERLAELRLQKVQRLKAVSQLQSVADEIGQVVKERIREIDRAFHEIELDHQVVEAIAVELQALEELEKTRARLTPEFLRLKLDTQSSLADAKVAELRAIRAYNVAIADLTRVTGTILMQYQVDILLPAAEGGAWPAFDERPAPATTSTPAAARRARPAAGTPAVASQ